MHPVELDAQVLDAAANTHSPYTSYISRHLVMPRRGSLLPCFRYHASECSASEISFAIWITLRQPHR